MRETIAEQLMLERETKQAAWYAELLTRAMRETNNVAEAMVAAELAFSLWPIPEEVMPSARVQHNGERTTQVHANKSDAAREPVPVPVGDGAAFAFDIFNKRAQGVLNRAVSESKKLTTSARAGLKQALSLKDNAAMARAVVEFVNNYRIQLSELLGATSLAALLEGAREVARKVPGAFPPAGAGLAPPPTLPPGDALALLERLRSLPPQKREEAIYELPPDQQRYAQQAMKEGPPVPPPPFRPEPPESGSPERIQFPIIDEASRELGEKNVVTREVFDRLDDATRQKAFTVTGVDASETLTKIRDSMAKHIKEGVDVEEGKAKVLEEVSSGTFLSEAHLANVYRTNIQAAFSDGQMGVLKHPFVRSAFPYTTYDAIHDSRVRHNHLALESLGIQNTNVYRIDDPVFREFRPPWDYQDRCSWIPLTIQMAADKGISEAKEWLKTGVEPQPPAWVPHPPFQAPASFRRDLEGVTLSIRLSLLSLEEIVEEVETEMLLVGQGAGTATQIGDYASERTAAPWKHKAVIRKSSKTHGKKAKGKLPKGKSKRKLSKGLRLPFGGGRAKMSVDSIPAEPKSSEPTDSKEGITATVDASITEIGVWHDYDEDKAVMVGIPDRDVLPAWYPAILEDPMGNEVDGPPGVSKRDFDPPKFYGAIRQLDDYCRILEKSGTTVYRSPLPSWEVAKQEPTGLGMNWIRETFVIIHKNIVMCQMRSPHRNKEGPLLDNFFANCSAKDPEVRILRPPSCTYEMNTDWVNDPRPFLEGGDVYRLGNDVLVGMSYLASSPAGFRWLHDELEPQGITVWPAYVKPDWEHLDYILTLVRPGLCIAYRKGFVDELLPSPITDWDCIEVTFHEANEKFASNCTTTRPGVVMIPEGNRRVVRELERRGCDAVEVPFDDVYYWQGGIDCATNELYCPKGD